MENIISENKNHFIGNKNLLYITIIIICGVMFGFPSILYGFSSGGHDSFAHLTWSKQFSDQLWEGEIYPRWLINDSSGFGSPVFFYVGPVPYYISSFLSPILGNDPYGWQRLGISSVIGLVTSGVCAFLWIKGFTNLRVALFSAILYMIFPYHLAIDLYERAAFPEFWTFVWMPLILYFVNQIKKGKKYAILGTSISYALLIMTHLPTTLIFSIIPIAYSVINVSRTKNSSFLTTTISMMLGISLSAIYLYPALSTQGYVNVAREAIWTLYMDNLLFTTLIPTDKFMTELYLVVIGMILITVSAAIIYTFSSEVKLRSEFIFWVVVAILSVFMMTPLSKPVVEWFQIIHRIQFPWRFNTLLILANTALFGISICSLRKPFSRILFAPIAVSALLVTSWIGINLWQGIQESREDKASINERISQGSHDFNFRPMWVQVDPREFAAEVARVNVVLGSGEAEVTRWEPRDIRIKVDFSSSAILTIGQLYYPGWTAHIIGQPCCLRLQPSDSKGLVNISVPAGNYEIAIRLITGPQEFIGQLISGVSLVIIIMLFGWFSFKRGADFRTPRGSQPHLQ